MASQSYKARRGNIPGPWSDNPRWLALEVLQQVVAGGRSLGDALTDGQSGLGRGEDRAFVQELCYGSLRWHFRLRALAEALLSRPLKPRDQDLLLVIELGLYQLLYTRVPAHAALAETVELARALGKPWAVGLVNGVLRRFQRELPQRLSAADARDEVRYAFPPWLQQSLSTAWPECWRQILEACNQRPPMSLRVNLRRTGRDQYLARLAAEGLSAEPLPYLSEGLVLDRPVEVQRVPGFSEGLISVQDGGAQLAAGLLQLEPGQRVLDACAAPGGKTCHILESAPHLAELVALDLDADRLERVRENLRRLDLRATVVQGDAAAPEGAWATPGGYQRILLDAPCSATGVIRRHPDIKILRRAQDIPALVDLQTRMLEAIWPLLAPAGILVYATCSLLPQENEQQLKSFLARRSDARELPIRADWGHARDVGRQTLPGEQSMDGFYYACLEKL